jgi:4a-hydroxytetrahydrobiopterin dehydratase
MERDGGMSGGGDVEGWVREEGGGLERWYAFASFGEALAFVNRVGALAEELGHHPDIDLRYRRVRVRLWTYDAGGVTERDWELARAIGERG